MFKMFTTGQSTRIQMVLPKSAASHPVSAPAHLLALEWSSALSKICKMFAALHHAHLLSSD